MISYVVGDATEPKADGSRIIVHICNDVGGWGRGFVLALSKKWKTPEAQYRQWYKDGSGFELGAVQFVEVEANLWVANLIGQRNIYAINGVPPIRYDAIRLGLDKVAKFALEKSASVHMPRIGCGLAGGNWDSVEPIIDEALCSQKILVTVYDLEV